MVEALELHDQGPAGCGPGETERRLNGLGPATGEPDGVETSPFTETGEAIAPSLEVTESEIAVALSDEFLESSAEDDGDFGIPADNEFEEFTI